MKNRKTAGKPRAATRKLELTPYQHEAARLRREAFLRRCREAMPGEKVEK